MKFIAEAVNTFGDAASAAAAIVSGALDTNTSTTAAEDSPGAAA